MKKFLLILTGTVLIGMFLQANAIALPILSVGDANYVGEVDPGAPANETEELGFINTLITLDPGDTDTIGSQTYDRVGSTLTGLPTALAPYSKQDNSNPVFDATGLEYILGKYGGYSLVWYIGNFDGDVTLPSAALSHTTGFNAGQTAIPEPATMLLVGIGLIGIAGFGRKKIRKS